ncbi:SLAM family member 9-like [Triplophysa dalaica]|uniref:SLAM family member 9-like n=1 Tax=Triplophysa dalaica TaxID=1582913 RepID=UPI0024DF31D5|nr:SLAM family member 9-like [Triplophysa dalaica]XP_056615251.1 SLAM family member 9-like [Triplophysa dalaica]
MLRNSICETTLFYWLFFIFVTNGVFGVDGDEVKSVSVMEGDSVTLHTNLTHIQRQDQILWMFGPRIAEIYKETIDMFDSRKTFGDRLKLNNQTGSLNITNIRTEHTGLYKLQIRSYRGDSDKIFNVTVYARLPVPVITRVSNSSNCSSSSERSSVSKCVLLCSVMNVTHVSLSWYKGNSLLSSISVSDLNIRLSLPLEVEYQDTNTYRCVINNPITNHTQHLDINDLCQPCSAHSSKAIYATIIFVCMIILAAGLLLLYRKRKQASKKGFEPYDHAGVKKEEEEVQYAETVFCRQNEQKTAANGTDETIYSSVI